MQRRKTIDWEDDYSAPKRRFLPARIPLRWSGWSVLTLVVLVGLYYGIGSIWIHAIDDNPDFAPTEVPPGGSRAVAAAVALVDREVNQHVWTANKPWFFPSYPLDNMPNYQQGIIGALWRFGIEMSDQIGRTRGSSEVDADLENAAGLLKYPGDRWYWNPSQQLMPISSSESQYRNAMNSLMAYNRRLAAGEAVFEIRADNLLGTLDRIASDLGSVSATIDQHLAAPRPWVIDTKVDDIFYNAKGRLYAYYIILKELGQDFDKVIQDKDVGQVWERMLFSLRQAAELDPLIIVNGAPDAAFMPSHLPAQGFYLLRARTQLREISNVLQN
jgi:hypothetical protein